MLSIALIGLARADDNEDDLFIHVPMPPGFQVVVTELEGPVFADAEGMTLYAWPQRLLRNGYSGEPKGRIECYDIVRTKTAGLMSPYPPGVILPELENRPSCTDLWRPVLAEPDAESIGEWSILVGDDGRRQWAYYEQPLYTSNLDQKPGDTIGGMSRRYGGEGAASRDPVGPPPNVPPGFDVYTTALGGRLATKEGRSVYVYEGERDCTGACLQHWEPLIAPGLAQSNALWSPVDRPSGVRQWSYRGQLVYTYANDTGQDPQAGTDIEGWHNVYTYRTPSPPDVLTRQDTIAGEVLADARGRTIYLYSCGDDSIDQLSCDHPSDTQVYRLAICGDGDPERCNQKWSYVEANDDATSSSMAWSILWIDPMTGHKARANEDGALRVWAYRDRPVYTYYLDQEPGDVRGDATGEWRGGRNGLKAFWIRNVFFDGQ